VKTAAAFVIHTPKRTGLFLVNNPFEIWLDRESLLPVMAS
jgi:hypothetical protein